MNFIATEPKRYMSHHKKYKTYFVLPPKTCYNRLLLFTHCTFRLQVSKVKYRDASKLTAIRPTDTHFSSITFVPCFLTSVVALQTGLRTTF